MNTNLELLRELMRAKGVDAVIIPGTDPHQSEYVSDHWKFFNWVSGFTGEGSAVVTLKKAGLWTDSRYFLQAEIELEGSGFKLHKDQIPGELTIRQWLAQELSEDDTLAVDGRLFSLMESNQLEQFCGENGFLFATDFFPADEIWEGRPPRPMAPAFVHDEEYAGEDVESKLARTLEKVEESGADSILITALDEIAWLLNLRGSDVEFTPVAIAFFYMSEDNRVLFIDESKITSEVKDHLKKYKVRIKEYDEVEKFLEKRSMGDTIMLDPNKVSDTLGEALMCGKVYGASPVAALKAIKNDVQIAGFRKSMERDGAALVRLFMWIEQNAASGTINEIDVWERGKMERGKSDLYRGDSFEMICGYREHGAIVHYSATPESASTLKGEGLLLVDSGAQYLDGTTDITRTVTLGNPTAQEKHDYTLVLKGHLALSRAKFPVGTTGIQLDAFARMPLWQEAMTYGHGTGHGIGQFLGVHEGPHGIRFNQQMAFVALEPGMVTSNEPGLYKTGEYGIRTENVLLVVEGSKTEAFGDFLEFETLTLFPYDNRLIDTTMLSPEEVQQINDYHAMVLERLTPHLNEDEVAWLAEKCKALV
ncbi:MAG: aminopeptidase P family protein [Muribaculaceae bacterium]|nr:aminopeptidase P family protein [Muribaculaceae bacterium]